MISETSIPLLGGSGRIIQPDALDGVSGSPETFVCTVRTKRYLLFGPNGEGVGKRMFVQVTHENGCGLSVTPFVDSKRQTLLQRSFSAPANGELSRASFLVPLGRPGKFTAGLRGTSFGAEITVNNPRVQFHVEALTIEAEPQAEARGRKATE